MPLKLLERKRRLLQFSLCIVFCTLLVYYGFHTQGLLTFGWKKTLPTRFIRRIITDELPSSGQERQRQLTSFCLDGSALPPLPSSSSSSTSSTRHHHHNNQNNNGDSNTPLATDLDIAASLIKTKYSRLLESTVSNVYVPSSKCQPLVVEYSCSENWQCGGLGDRFRGLVAVFYISLLTNSVFSNNWAYPTKLDDFFEQPFFSRKMIFDELLPIVPAEYEQQDIDEEKAIVKFFNATLEVRNAQAWHDLLVFQINSLVPLEVFLKHPYYRPVVDYYGLANYTYSELFAIALRILLPKRSSFLEESIAPFVNELKSQRYDARFGLQVRLGSPGWGEYDRVNFDQLGCFVDELADITRRNDYRNIFVFVTADSDAAVQTLEEAIKTRLKRVSSQISVNVTSASRVASITHIDRSPFNSEKNKKAATLRTFVDWALLAAPEVDHLIISRSSFGETAGLMHQVGGVKLANHRVVRRLLHNVTDKCSFHNFELTTFRMEGSSALSKHGLNKRLLLLLSSLIVIIVKACSTSVIF